MVEIEPGADKRETGSCRIGELVPGMIIDEEIRTDASSLIVARNQEFTPFLILKQVVAVPKTSAAAAK